MKTKIMQFVSKVTFNLDSYTFDHQKRVAETSVKIAQEMGFSKEVINDIKVAALNHDIGKAFLPSQIIGKIRTLTDQEFNTIKNHPQIGYQILKQNKYPDRVARIVLQHHERLNGSGYPAGLTGKNILIEARIISVADVIDAMSSDRVYQPNFGIDQAIGEISEYQGILYDPEVIYACLKSLGNKWRPDKVNGLAFWVPPDISIPPGAGFSPLS